MYPGCTHQSLNQKKKKDRRDGVAAASEAISRKNTLGFEYYHHAMTSVTQHLRAEAQ
jgi:hypothetical protein